MNQEELERGMIAFRKVLENTGEYESAMTELRRLGYWKLRSANIIRHTLNISIEDAIKMVHCSETWADVRERDERFEDQLHILLQEVATEVKIDEEKFEYRFDIDRTNVKEIDRKGE